MPERYDLIVIGGGPGGYVAAIRGAHYGLKTALVEERQLGGTCLNRGCIPTKTLLHASQLFREVQEGEGIGIYVDALRFDIKQLYQRKDAVVSELRNGISHLLNANGVACYSGKARVTGNHEVRINGESNWEIQGSQIVLATGASPVKPNIPGANLPGVMTSDELLNETPVDYKRLVIIGGGVIGMEMASIYGNLGCKVTIIEAKDRILPTLDREIAQNLSMILKKRGISIHTGSLVQEIKKDGDALSLCFVGKKGEETVECDLVLLSMGRRPQIEDLLDDGLALESDHGIVVNERFETSIPGIYAIGDCVSDNIQLAHVASAQAKYVVDLMTEKEAELELSVVPACIYTNPEIAWVGITADEAKKMGKAVKTTKYTMSGNGKSIIERQDRGFIKLVFDAESKVLLGAQLMCGRATELIGELATAIVGKRTAKELSSVIRPHPTFGEAVGEAVEVLFDKAVHMAPKRSVK